MVRQGLIVRAELGRGHGQGEQALDVVRVERQGPSAAFHGFRVAAREVERRADQAVGERSERIHL